MDNERKINLISLGDNAVGKTSIINRIKYGTFQEIYSPSICTDFFIIKKKYEKKNIMFNFALCDTPGQEGFERAIPKEYFNNSHIVLLVFSDIETLNELKHRWYTFYKEYVNIEYSRFILVGNKSDIFGNERDEIIKQGEKFAEDIDAVFITCSAKTGDNVDNLESYITNEAKRYIDFEDKEKEYKRANLKKDNNDNLLRVINYDDEDKVSLWRNSKLNKYISF